jgi:hypothetical protein
LYLDIEGHFLTLDIDASFQVANGGKKASFVRWGWQG